MKFYRYDVSHGEYENSLQCTEYCLHKETPKGYWIGVFEVQDGKLNDLSRWVSKTAMKRHAYPTKKEALHSFICRKKREKRILNARLEGCEFGLETALRIQKDIAQWETVAAIPISDFNFTKDVNVKLQDGQGW